MKTKIKGWVGLDLKGKPYSQIHYISTTLKSVPYYGVFLTKAGAHKYFSSVAPAVLTVELKRRIKK